MIRNFIFGIYLLISDLLEESLKTNENLLKISAILQYRFAQKISLILRTSTHSILKRIYSRNTTKNMFLVVVRKKYLHCTISRCPRTAFLEHLESKYLYILVHLRSKFFFSRNVRSFYLVGG